MFNVKGRIELGISVLRKVRRKNGLMAERIVVKRGGIERMEGLGGRKRSIFKGKKGINNR